MAGSSHLQCERATCCASRRARNISFSRRVETRGSLDGLPRFAVVRGGEFLAAGGSERGRRGVRGRDGSEIGWGWGVDLLPGDASARAVDCAFCTHNPAHVRSRSTAGSEFRVSADELTIPGCTAVRCARNESPSGQAITNLRVGGPNWDICGSFLDDEGALSGWSIWLLESSEQETGETGMRKHGLPRAEKCTGKGQKATKVSARAA